MRDDGPIDEKLNIRVELAERNHARARQATVGSYGGCVLIWKQRRTEHSRRLESSVWSSGTCGKEQRGNSKGL